jgi:hypothetical protein
LWLRVVVGVVEKILLLALAVVAVLAGLSQAQLLFLLQLTT